MNKFSRAALVGGVALFSAAVYVWGLWDGQQPSVASTATDSGVAFGRDGGVIPELRQLPSRGIMLTENIIPKMNTFTDTGDRFPLGVRYFLPGPLPDFASARSTFLLYSHYEKRWGKDLSWTKSTGLSHEP
jgi:hypothetical protein